MKNWLLAWRSLARHRAFTVAIVCILALGIGANTAMFSLVDAVILKPLPYPDPGRLVSVLEASPAKNEKASLIAPARLVDWQRLNRAFDALSASYTDHVTDTTGSEPERLTASRVSPRYFEVFGVRPLLGRWFTAGEEEYGGPQVVIISYDFWSRRFREAPDVIGRRLVLGGKGYTVAGVMPKHFEPAAVDVSGGGAALWIPAQVAPDVMRVRDARFLIGIGRMKPGVTVEQARSDLDRVQTELAKQYPATDRGWSATVTGLKQWMVGEHRRSLLFALGAVALLLLIAVANIAGLMLSQLDRRAREMAICSSLGATRFQVAAGVLREVALIAAMGIVLGCAFASWLDEAMAQAFQKLPHVAEMQLDWRALAFAAVAGALAALFCGLLPALQATRADVALLLARGGRGDSGQRRRWQPALVACQMALSVVLLASAGLMLRSYHNLTRVNVGFDPAHAVTFHVSAAWEEDRTRVGQLQEQVLARVRQVPGVEAAGFTNFLPAEGATLRYQVALEGAAQTTGSSDRITVGERSVSGGYFQAMGAPLIAGRACPALTAISGKTPKALVSARFARQYGNGENIVGRHLRWFDVGDGPPMEIVGIAGEMREDTMNVAPAPYVYVCIAPGGWPDPEYVVRTSGDPRAFMGTVRALVRGVDPSRAVFGMKPLQDVLDEGLRDSRLNTRMLASFALAAIALACVGLYSLMSLVVTSRTREIGVRMTLGAAPGTILLHILAGVGRLLGVALVLGLLLTMAVDRVLRSLLFGVSPLDPLTLCAAIVALAAVAVIAAIGPARRAASIDPIAALRLE